MYWFLFRHCIPWWFIFHGRDGFEFVELTMRCLKIPKKKVYFIVCICALFSSARTSKFGQHSQDLRSNQRGQNTQRFGAPSAGGRGEFSGIWSRSSFERSCLWVCWSDLHAAEIGATATEGTGGCGSLEPHQFMSFLFVYMSLPCSFW